MSQSEKLPTVSILIATLNSSSVLEKCLASISSQDYPKEKVEIIVSDGGSTDDTLQIAEKYNAKIVLNKLKTAESGKMVALREASGKYAALIDSDNILPDTHWLKEMLAPLEKHKDIMGSEPIEYTWRKEDGFITRYCALIGMNDPLTLFFGNYDRINLITNTWTEVERTEQDYGNYIVATFRDKNLPTIGANGTLFRTNFLKKNVVGDYLFDIDILAGFIEKKGEVKFIKVKTGIVHLFCENSISTFARKQRRRICDFLFHSSKDSRSFWSTSDIYTKKSFALTKFIVYTVTIFPLLFQSLNGYRVKRDVAWFFHPIACLITLWEYGKGVISGLVSKKELDRSTYGQ